MTTGTQPPDPDPDVLRWCSLLRSWDRGDLNVRDTVVREIYHKLARRVLIIAIQEVRKIGLPPDAAEDVLTETFAALLGHVHRNPSGFASKLESYEVGGLVKLLKMMVRQQVCRQAKKAQLAGKLEPMEILDSWWDPGDADPVARTVTNAVVVWQLLDQLPEQDRLLLRLYYWEGMTFIEIDREMNLNEGTAKARHWHILRRLRRRWETAEE